MFFCASFTPSVILIATIVHLFLISGLNSKDPKNIRKISSNFIFNFLCLLINFRFIVGALSTMSIRTIITIKIRLHFLFQLRHGVCVIVSLKSRLYLLIKTRLGGGLRNYDEISELLKFVDTATDKMIIVACCNDACFILV